jgi:hypothetical protein
MWRRGFASPALPASKGGVSGSADASARTQFPLSSLAHTYFPTILTDVALPVAPPPPRTIEGAPASSKLAITLPPGKLATATERFEQRHVSRIGFGGPLRAGTLQEVQAERLRNYIKRGGNAIDFAPCKYLTFGSASKRMNG